MCLACVIILIINQMISPSTLNSDEFDYDPNAKSPLEPLKTQIFEKRKAQISGAVENLLNSNSKGVIFNLTYQIVYNFTMDKRQDVKGLLEAIFKAYLQKTLAKIDENLKEIDFLDSFCDIWDKYYSGLPHIKKIFDFYVIT